MPSAPAHSPDGRHRWPGEVRGRRVTTRPGAADRGDARGSGRTPPARPGRSATAARPRAAPPASAGRVHGLVHAKPVRADRSPAQELEQGANRHLNAQLLGQPPGSCLLVRLTHAHGPTERHLLVAGETRQAPGPPVDRHPPLPIEADRCRDAVRPASADGLAALHHHQHPLLTVHAFHGFVHGTHDRPPRRRSRPDRTAAGTLPFATGARCSLPSSAVSDLGTPPVGCFGKIRPRKVAAVQATGLSGP